MKIGTIGLALIALGVIILIYALNMPVSRPYSDIVNFQMISDRQNMLLLGGLFFISGIILFAVSKLKQTASEDAPGRSQIENKEGGNELLGTIPERVRTVREEPARSVAANQLGNNAAEQIVAAKIAKLPSFSQKKWGNFVGLSQGWQSIIIRATTAIALWYALDSELYPIGSLVLGLGADASEKFTNWIPMLLIVYAFRRAPLLNVMKHILSVGLLITICVCVRWMMDHVYPHGVVLYSLIGEVISLTFVFTVEWKKKKEFTSIQSIQP